MPSGQKLALVIVYIYIYLCMNSLCKMYKMECLIPKHINVCVCHLYYR